MHNSLVNNQLNPNEKGSFRGNMIFMQWLSNVQDDYDDAPQKDRITWKPHLNEK